jgi:hypothetical protein
MEYIYSARAVHYDPSTDIIRPTHVCDPDDVDELNLMYQAGRLQLTPVIGWGRYNYLAVAVCDDDLPMAWLVELVDHTVDSLDDDLYGD